MIYRLYYKKLVRYNKELIKYNKQLVQLIYFNLNSFLYLFTKFVVSYIYILYTPNSKSLAAVFVWEGEQGRFDRAREGAGGSIAQGAERREQHGQEEVNPLVGFALDHTEESSLDNLQRVGLHIRQNKQ